jgi:hypothetical protein
MAGILRGADIATRPRKVQLPLPRCRLFSRTASSRPCGRGQGRNIELDEQCEELDRDPATLRRIVEGHNDAPEGVWRLPWIERLPRCRNLRSSTSCGRQMTGSAAGESRGDDRIPQERLDLTPDTRCLDQGRTSSPSRRAWARVEGVGSWRAECSGREYGRARRGGSSRAGG